MAKKSSKVFRRSSLKKNEKQSPKIRRSMAVELDKQSGRLRQALKRENAGASLLYENKEPSEQQKAAAKPQREPQSAERPAAQPKKKSPLQNRERIRLPKGEKRSRSASPRTRRKKTAKAPASADFSGKYLLSSCGYGRACAAQAAQRQRRYHTVKRDFARGNPRFLGLSVRPSGRDRCSGQRVL